MPRKRKSEVRVAKLGVSQLSLNLQTILKRVECVLRNRNGLYNRIKTLIKQS